MGLSNISSRTKCADMPVRVVSSHSACLLVALKDQLSRLLRGFEEKLHSIAKLNLRFSEKYRINSNTCC